MKQEEISILKEWTMIILYSILLIEWRSRSYHKIIIKEERIGHLTWLSFSTEVYRSPSLMQVWNYEEKKWLKIWEIVKNYRYQYSKILLRWRPCVKIDSRIFEILKLEVQQFVSSPQFSLSSLCYPVIHKWDRCSYLGSYFGEFFTWNWSSTSTMDISIKLPRTYWYPPFTKILAGVIGSLLQSILSSIKSKCRWTIPSRPIHFHQ